MTIKKQSLTPYELKLQELSSAIQKKARELSDLEGQITEANSAIASKAKELGVLQAKYDKLLKESSEIEESNKRNVVANQATEKGSATAVEGMRTEVAMTSGQKRSLEREIKTLEGKLENLKSEKKALELSIKELLSDIQGAKIELRKLHELIGDANQRIREAKQAEQSAAALVAKNSRQLSAIEVQRSTLEHYVKRLQRIYDKQGIKIDLLKQFGIKRDRIEK